MKHKYLNYILFGIFALILVFNQVTVSHVASKVGHTDMYLALVERVLAESRDITGEDLTGVDLSQIKSTAQGVAAIMPMHAISTPQDAIAVMVPTGIPEYGQAMGVSFDDAEGSLTTLSKAQPALLQSLTPEQKARFIALASQPIGISCEYCCGVGPIGIREDGSSACGCQHNPALLSVTMWLMQNTDYSDAEILREVYKWKSLFFPKNMVDLAVKISGGDTSVLEELPGMVGGC